MNTSKNLRTEGSFCSHSTGTRRRSYAKHMIPRDETPWIEFGRAGRTLIARGISDAIMTEWWRGVTRYLWRGTAALGSNWAYTYDPRLGVTECVGLQGKGIGGARASERDGRWDGRAFLAAFDVEKMSNVNVNFGDPGLVGRGQDGYLGVSSRVRSRWGAKKKEPVTRCQGPETTC